VKKLKGAMAPPAVGAMIAEGVLARSAVKPRI
jgi:hypothetical protein